MAENDELKEHLNESQAMLEEAMTKNVNLEAQIAEMTDEINYRAAQITEMEKEIAEMGAEIDRLTAIVQDYENSNWHHPDWEDPNYQKIQELEEIIADLQCQLANRLDSIAAQEEEIAKLKIHIAELEETDEGTDHPDSALPGQP